MLAHLIFSPLFDKKIFVLFVQQAFIFRVSIHECGSSAHPLGAVKMRAACRGQDPTCPNAVHYARMAPCHQLCCLDWGLWGQVLEQWPDLSRAGMGWGGKSQVLSQRCIRYKMDCVLQAGKMKLNPCVCSDPWSSTGYCHFFKKNVSFLLLW